VNATRRDVLASTAALGLAAAAPRLAAAQADTGGPVHDPQLRALTDAFVQERLALSPEQATSLGLDKGANAVLKSEFGDRSAAGLARAAAAARGRLQRLRGLDRARLTGSDLTLYDTIAYYEQLNVDGARFGYGQTSADGAVPYVVTQQSGAYQETPEFLNSNHVIETRADADAYLARIEGFAIQLDQETPRIQADAARGVIPPDFIVANMLGQMRQLRAEPAAQSGLVTSLTRRVKEKGLDGDYAGPAARLVTDKVHPALDRQIAAVQAIAPRATHEAGVWRLPDGAAYYAFALRQGTTTPMTPAEVHALGLQKNAEITVEMDAILKRQGRILGSVGQRMATLSRDPKFLFPDTDAGRAELIAYLNDKIAEIRPLLARVSNLHLKAEVQVKAVPANIQDGAPQGYMNFAALDGSRPAIYYINLKDTANWPRWSLPTLTTHETIPGHAWQGAYLAERRSQVPLISSLQDFNAFVEGWALYAEQLADEAGLYQRDPYGRLGYLQAQKFRACRLVVDTGLHAPEFKWTREQAVAFMVEQTGRTPPALTSEVDRYCANPGQACGYKVGQTQILRLRAQAQTALGPRFDLRGFDDAIVKTGGVPLTVLDSVVARWTASVAG